MTRFYDARGNIYGVVSPAHLRGLGIDVPDNARLAASTREMWAASAIASECGWGALPPPTGAKAYRCDGLLVGPFQARPPFDLLIINTDSSLAERSGNGLTIFAQAVSPVITYVEPAKHEQVPGFWLALGRPEFGPLAVGAVGVSPVVAAHHEFSRVAALASINAQWGNSQFVRIGNPHCVTLVEHVSALPVNDTMHQLALFNRLKAIAFAPPAGCGQLCVGGVNLQWVARDAGNRVIARVFERGEGPTASSGTSASAVACAAWRAGWIEGDDVTVVMPGGTAPVRLQTESGNVLSVSLFGTARLTI